MRAAEEGIDDTLDADIAFHVAVLRASGNLFYAQFRDVVSTALRTSIRFTNRIAGRTASILPIMPPCTRRSLNMMRTVGEVLTLIEQSDLG